MNPITITQDVPRYGVNYDVGFNGFTVRRKDFIAAGIRWFERWDRLPGVPPVSHAFVITGQDSTIEAFGDGVHEGTLSAYLQDPDVALLVRRPRGWTLGMGLAIENEAAKHIGEHYGYGLIAAMALQNTFLGRGLDLVTGGRFGHFVDNLADGKREEICSELTAQADVAGFQSAIGYTLKESLPGCLGKMESCEITPAILFGDVFVFEPGAVELVPAGTYAET